MTTDDGLNEFVEKVGKNFKERNRNESIAGNKLRAPQKNASDDENIVEPIKNQNGVWMTFDNSKVYMAAQGSAKELPSDTYMIGMNRSGIYFRRLFINTDEIFEMPDTNSKKILRHLEIFWQRESVFRKYNFLWKRGILLFGPQGAGKTSLLNLVTKKAVQLGSIIAYVDSPEVAVDGLRILREIEPKRCLVVILEDIDTMIHNHGESDMLRLLDGENQVDNVVFIATTNYPENLNPRLINRPSRFDIVMKIELPSEAARRFYLHRVNPRFKNSTDIKEELEKWVIDTNGFSVAHLKDLVVSVEIMGAPYEDSVLRLRKMSNPLSSNNDTASKLGFVKAEEKGSKGFELDDSTDKKEESAIEKATASFIIEIGHDGIGIDQESGENSL